jgi:hypothetical protein
MRPPPHYAGRRQAAARHRKAFARWFDLPVLRYRAMVNGVSAPGLSLAPSRFRPVEPIRMMLSGLSWRTSLTVYSPYRKSSRLIRT